MSWVTLDRIVSEEIVRDDGIRRRVAESAGRCGRTPPAASDDGRAMPRPGSPSQPARRAVATPCRLPG